MEQQVAMMGVRRAGVLGRQEVGLAACAEQGCNHSSIERSTHTPHPQATRPCPAELAHDIQCKEVHAVAALRSRLVTTRML